MLIDSNAYIGHWPFLQLQYATCKGLLQKMDSYGVDRSVISNINSIFYKNVQSGNEELYNEIQSRKQFANRFIPFAVINPCYAGAMDDLEICHREFGMKGIRLYPKYHDYALTDPACLALTRRARDLGMVVALTLRMVDFRQRSWLDIKEEWSLRDVMPLIRAVPDAKFMILNIANGPVLSEEDTALFRKTNVLMDTSGRALINLPDLLSRYGETKFAFGTHAPVQDYLTGLLRIDSLRDSEVSPHVRSLMRSENVRRMLELQGK